MADPIEIDLNNYISRQDEQQRKREKAYREVVYNLRMARWVDVLEALNEGDYLVGSDIANALAKNDLLTVGEIVKKMYIDYYLNQELSNDV